MDIGILKRDDSAVWVSFDDAEVLIRYVGADELRRINREATRASLDENRRKVEELDAGEANRLLGRAAVRGWLGITMEGAEYPYTQENCDFLMARWLEFARFVGAACLDLRALGEAEAKKKSKGLSNTSGREGTTPA